MRRARSIVCRGTLPARDAVRALVVVAALAVITALGSACTEAPKPSVTLWHTYNGSERAALEAAGDRWNVAHPDTPLTLVAIPYDAFADKLTSAIPAGNGPDLFIFAHDRLGSWSDAGVLEPIEFWVDDARADRFSADAMSQLAYHGSLYGLPVAEKALALYYRTDLVATPPATTDALVALAPAMTAKKGFALAYTNVDLYGHAPWLHGFGGKVMNDDGSLGRRGRVTNELEARLDHGRAATSAQPLRIMACGPRQMLWAVGRIAQGYGVECYLSLEEQMACGIGVCLGCAVAAQTSPYLYVCKDGPVFAAAEVMARATAASTSRSEGGAQ